MKTINEKQFRKLYKDLDCHQFNPKKLSESLIREFADQINWSWIVYNKQLTKDFFREFEEKYNLTEYLDNKVEIPKINIFYKLINKIKYYYFKKQINRENSNNKPYYVKYKDYIFDLSICEDEYVLTGESFYIDLPLYEGYKIKTLKNKCKFKVGDNVKYYDQKDDNMKNGIIKFIDKYKVYFQDGNVTFKEYVNISFKKIREYDIGDEIDGKMINDYIVDEGCIIYICDNGETIYKSFL